MRTLAILAAVMLAGCGAVPRKTTHRLTFGDGVCSATAVGRNTILSAAHCFEGAHSLSIDGVPVEVAKIVSDGSDHVLVTVSATFQDVAKRGHSTHVSDRVHYWGNPTGLHDLYREGYVAGVAIIGGKAVTLIDSNIFYGDSGAGVFDASSRLIGVVSVLYQDTNRGYIKFMGMYPLRFTAKQWAEVQ
jgi:V8-like Glu-specific endopeptidase